MVTDHRHQRLPNLSEQLTGFASMLEENKELNSECLRVCTGDDYEDWFEVTFSRIFPDFSGIRIFGAGVSRK